MILYKWQLFSFIVYYKSTEHSGMYGIREQDQENGWAIKIRVRNFTCNLFRKHLIFFAFNFLSGFLASFWNSFSSSWWCSSHLCCVTSHHVQPPHLSCLRPLRGKKKDEHTRFLGAPKNILSDRSLSLPWPAVTSPSAPQTPVCLLLSFFCIYHQRFTYK